MLDPWFDLLCFVLVLGLSQSILFSINASTGGLDIVAKIVNKYCHLNLGSSVMVCGCIICSMAILVNDITMVLVGLIGTWLNGLVFIISGDHEKIQQYVINTMRRGLTLHPVYGGYSNQRQMQIEVVLTPDEFSDLVDFMHKEKIRSFMTSDTVSQVHGIWNKRHLLDFSGE